MSAIQQISAGEYEQVLIVQERETELISITAVHNTVLGPALGGLRMRPYGSLEEALSDVLNLARAMTYKNSLCGCNLGGGKSVIIADSDHTHMREERLMAYGRFVQSLGGAYITAEDMGTSVEDMSVIMRTCDYVTGRDPAVGGGGDPSSHTARGVFEGMRACLERAFGSSDFTGRHIAIQGVGSVGYYLVKLLAEAGAKLTVSDTEEDRISLVSSEFTVQTADVDQIIRTECDIFSPCAVGGTINPRTAEELNCKIVAGAANNQIEGDDTERSLASRGIMYAPDFAINAGGVIMCGDELESDGYSLERVTKRVVNIYHTVGKILDEAKLRNELPGTVAVDQAIRRIMETREKRSAATTSSKK